MQDSPGWTWVSLWNVLERWAHLRKGVCPSLGQEGGGTLEQVAQGDRGCALPGGEVISLGLGWIGLWEAWSGRRSSCPSWGELEPDDLRGPIQPNPFYDSRGTKLCPESCLRHTKPWHLCCVCSFTSLASVSLSISPIWWQSGVKCSIKIAYTRIDQILSNFTPVSPFLTASFN